jgi:hypothetical protein
VPDLHDPSDIALYGSPNAHVFYFAVGCRSLVTIVVDAVAYISGTGFEGGALWQAQNQAADEDKTSTSAQTAEA